MISHGADLGRAGHRARGKACGERRHGVELRAQAAPDLAHQVHDVRVPLDGHERGEPHRPELRHPPDVVPAQVHQHQVLGPLLGVGRQLRRPAPHPAPG